MQNKRLLQHIIKNKPLFCKFILNIINYLLINLLTFHIRLLKFENSLYLGNHVYENSKNNIWPHMLVNFIYLFIKRLEFFVVLGLEIF